MVVLEEFLRSIWPIWWLWAPVASWGLLYGWLYKDLWRHDADRKRVVGWLIQDKPLATYRRVLTGLLDRIDARLSGRELARQMGPGRVAFSSGLIQLAMLLAVAYPILALVAQWVAGSPMLLGGVELAPAGAPVARAFMVVWLGLICAAVYWLSRRAPSPPRNWFIPALVTLIVWVGGMALSSQFHVPVAVARPVGYAGAVAITFVVTFAVTFPRLFAGAGAVAVAVTFAFTFADAFGVGVAVAVAAGVAGGVAIIGAAAVAIVEDRAGPRSQLWALWLAVLALALGGIVLSVPAIPGAEARMIIAFLGFLPLFNALADFASVGLTRYLLRRGLAGWGPKYAALDILGGAAVFALLGCTTIALFHWVRPQNGVALIDMAGLFAGLEQTPEHYWWLFVMLFSTLLPTLVHGMIAAFTLLLHYPPALRQRVVGWLDDGKSSDVSGRLGTAAWCTVLTLSVWVPVWLLWLALSYDHGALLRGIVGCFADFARLIGAI